MGGGKLFGRLEARVRLRLTSGGEQYPPCAAFGLTNSRVKRVNFRAGEDGDHIFGGGFIESLNIGKFYGQTQSWTESMQPLTEGRRHPLEQRKVDVERLNSLQVLTHPGHRLVSARRVIADAAKKGLPVGATNWGRRAQAFLRGALWHQVTPDLPVPTLVASASQLLFQIKGGEMAILSVEEEASLMEIPLTTGDGEWSMLGRFLLGVQKVVWKSRSTPRHTSAHELTALQAHAAIADSMHVGAVAEVVKIGWRRAIEVHPEELWSLELVSVHSSCAGLVNAGFLAVRKAMRNLGREAHLAEATESNRMRREALKLMYPGATISDFAYGPMSFGRRADILIISWPCTPYSTANVGSRVTMAEKRYRAWTNTLLVISILAKAAVQKGGPPFMVVLENVQGLITRQLCRPMLRQLMRELAGSIWTWTNQVVCPRQHFGKQCRRPRWMAVGILRPPPQLQADAQMLNACL